MRKFVAMLITLCLIFSLTACSSVTTPARKNLVPEGCTYTTADKVVISAGKEFPENTKVYDVYYTEDYTYFCGETGWSVYRVGDISKEVFSDILSEINGVPVISGISSFLWKGCANMKHLPKMPEAVYNNLTEEDFYGCISLLDPLPAWIDAEKVNKYNKRYYSNNTTSKTSETHSSSFEVTDNGTDSGTSDAAGNSPFDMVQVNDDGTISMGQY